MPVCESTDDFRTGLLFSTVSLGSFCTGVLCMISAYIYCRHLSEERQKLPLNLLSMGVLMSMCFERSARIWEFYTRFYMDIYHTQVTYNIANLFLYCLVILMFGTQLARLHYGFNGSAFEVSPEEMLSLKALVAGVTFAIAIWTGVNGVNKIALQPIMKYFLTVLAVIIVICTMILVGKLDYDFVVRLRKLVAKQRALAISPRPGMAPVQNSNTVSSRHRFMSSVKLPTNQRDSPIPSIVETPTTHNTLTLNDETPKFSDTPISSTLSPERPVTPSVSINGAHNRTGSAFDVMLTMIDQISRSSILDFAKHDRDLLQASTRSTVMSIILSMGVLFAFCATLCWTFFECDRIIVSVGHFLLCVSYSLIGMCMFVTVCPESYHTFCSPMHNQIQRVVAYQTHQQVEYYSQTEMDNTMQCDDDMKCDDEIECDAMPSDM